MHNIITKTVQGILGTARRRATEAGKHVDELAKQRAVIAAEVRDLSTRRNAILMRTDLKAGTPQAAEASRAADDLQRQLDAAIARQRRVEEELSLGRVTVAAAERQAKILLAIPAAADAADRLAKAQATVDALTAQNDEMRTKAEALAHERSRLALPAHCGDQEAKQRLATVHQEIAALAAETASLDDAFSEARKLVQVAAEAVAAAEKEQGMREAADLVHELQRRSKRIDELAAEMAGLLEERQTIVRKLVATGAYQTAAVHSLLRGHLITSALRAARLHKFCEIPGTGAGRSLAESDAVLNRVASNETNAA